MEIFKDIKGYEGIYQISNLGNVKSYKKNRVKIRIPTKNTNGYLCLGLRKNNKRKMYLIHRLISEYFIENKNNKPYINHIDGNKLNNNINNLEWCTQKENVNHSWKIGLSKISDYQKKLLSERNKNKKYEK
jgi:hypothetical protein